MNLQIIQKCACIILTSNDALTHFSDTTHALNRIETVIQNMPEIFSAFSKEEKDLFIEQTKKNVDQIMEGHRIFLSNLSVRDQYFISDEKKNKIANTYLKIQRFLFPSELPEGLVKDVFHIVARYLKITEIAKFCMINVKAHTFLQPLLKERAQDLKIVEADLGEVLFAVKNMHKLEYSCLIEDGYDPEDMIRKLRILNQLDMFWVFSYAKTYRCSLERIIPLLPSKEQKNLSRFEHINEIKISSCSALYLAVKNKNIDLVRVLLKNGACPNTCGILDNFPLDLAREQNDGEMFDLLLENGASLRFGSS